MKKIYFLFITFLLFTGCSFKLPPNQWQIYSATAFESYKKNFLGARDSLAQSDLARAIEHAKVSADLTTLARIYLGKCALNLSVGIKDNCSDYLLVQNLLDDTTLATYYALLTKDLEAIQLHALPDEYKAFTKALLENDFTQAYASLHDKSFSSKLIAASLIKEHLTQQQIEDILQESSFYGYKKAVIFWLKELEKSTVTHEEKDRIRNKIEILLKD